MGIHVTVRDLHLDGVSEVGSDRFHIVSSTRDGVNDHAHYGNLLELRAYYGEVLDELDRISRRRSMELHPSMFEMPCEGSAMPDGSAIPPGTGFVPPSTASAASWMSDSDPAA